MSNCIKDLFDYILVKKCCRCKKICLKSNFYKNVNRKDGVIAMCRICKNGYVREYMKNRLKTDVSFRLIRNTRRRIHHTLNGKTKSSSTLNILGIDFETYRRWIEWQMTPEMNWSKIEIDHVEPICIFDVSKDGKLGEAFCWKITQPLLEKDHQYKGTKFNVLDNQLQFIKSYQFLKLNEEGHKENFH